MLSFEFSTTTSGQNKNKTHANENSLRKFFPEQLPVISDLDLVCVEKVLLAAENHDTVLTSFFF